MLEQETIHAFVSGDEKALEEVINVYSRPLLRYCISIVCDSEDAKDVLQETFIKAYEKRRHFCLGTSMNSWLYRIAYTTAIDVVRKRKRRIKLFKAQSEKINNTRGNYISEPLYSILLSLSVADRALLYGRVLDERPYEELSQILNTSEAALRKRFERLRNRLAKKAEKKGEHRIFCTKEECVE
ncbi:RNA polymerase sigma factor [Paenibacillus sp. J2TS4]|uniref:RNA polymerase sigma factor n=1 Tax=Paenibacillus sp. J2TS4 TaxID=2807194 RepID=UPI001B2C6B5B|nr:RNA polymerase sigma factor [Paenibacillus sp. J2TS4]GIP32032.1 RNA polymerase sigma factor [Paenibacillus sp. J2TS4]